MKFFVTGVNGQLGHDVMNGLNKRGHEGVGSDIAEEYSEIEEGSAVCTMSYVSLGVLIFDYSILDTTIFITPGSCLEVNKNTLRPVKSMNFGLTEWEEY